MRPFAHDLVLGMSPDTDIREPGAVITVELCGTVDHPPPCPVAPHHTSARRDGDGVRLRVLFATEPEREDEVRARIGAALAARWEVRGSGPGVIDTPEEREHAARLARP